MKQKVQFQVFFLLEEKSLANQFLMAEQQSG